MFPEGDFKKKKIKNVDKKLWTPSDIYFYFPQISASVSIGLLRVKEKKKNDERELDLFY